MAIAWDEHKPPDLDLIKDCVHCGFCLPTCPSYVVFEEEMDSPRGRILLMRIGHEEGEEISDEMATHFDRCLGCMACVTACPSGVQYDKLIERVRPQVEHSPARSASERAYRRAIFALFTHPGRLRALAPGAKLGPKLAPLVPVARLRSMLSLAPSILVMMTSFTRIVVVLSLLRTALGTATAPPNAVIISLALFLTGFVMWPVFQSAYDAGIRPLVANEITIDQAFERASQPLRAFMLKNVREKDLKLFNDMANEPAPAQPGDLSLRILIPAFMISELKRAFEIGFLLFLPFLIIDLVVASVLMSMGMMMLPPVVVSLPFKLIFFVLVDGWSLVAGSLIQSYSG